METIVVEPLASGWAVKGCGMANEMVFLSGRDAESSARALAHRVASQGEPVRLKLRLRNSGTEVRMVCLPPLADTEPVRLVTLPISSVGETSGASDA